MATSNLALACLAVGTAALIFGFEWLLTIRARIQLRPHSQATYATPTTGSSPEGLERPSST
jgi:hypothetical protein